MPIISVVIGEGGSGGAIAIAVADKVYMLEHSIYSVISPEGCASILWRDGEYAKEAATALKLTAQDLKELNLVDEIISEPVGGAHRNKEETIQSVADQIEKGFTQLVPWEKSEIKLSRRRKFLKYGRDI